MIVGLAKTAALFAAAAVVATIAASPADSAEKWIPPIGDRAAGVLTVSLGDDTSITSAALLWGWGSSIEEVRYLPDRNVIELKVRNDSLPNTGWGGAATFDHEWKLWEPAGGQPKKDGKFRAEYAPGEPKLIHVPFFEEDLWNPGLYSFSLDVYLLGGEVTSAIQGSLVLEPTDQWRSNGCTGTELLDLETEVFTDACNNHDGCYGGRWARQATCDVWFLQDLRTICQTRMFNDSSCLSLANTFHLAVTVFGDKFYGEDPMQVEIAKLAIGPRFWCIEMLIRLSVFAACDAILGEDATNSRSE